MNILHDKHHHFFRTQSALAHQYHGLEVDGVPCTDYLPSTTFIKSMNYNMYVSSNLAYRSWMRVKYIHQFSYQSKSWEQKWQQADLVNHTHGDDSTFPRTIPISWVVDSSGHVYCKLQFGTHQMFQLFLTYLLAYLLHGAESLLRS